MWLWLCPALGAPPAPIEHDDGDDIDVPAQQPKQTPREGFGLDGLPDLGDDTEDDAGMADFVAQARRKAPPPSWFHLDLSDKAPLGDHFDIQIVAFNDRYVVVQLPVLVATNRASFVVEHPNGLTVVSEVNCGDQKLLQRQEFVSSSVFADSPTVAFFEAAFPVSTRSGTVRFLVRSAEGPPPEDPKRKGPVTPPALQDRFARTTVFMRP